MEPLGPLGVYVLLPMTAAVMATVRGAVHCRILCACAVALFVVGVPVWLVMPSADLMVDRPSLYPRFAPICGAIAIANLATAVWAYTASVRPIAAGFPVVITTAEDSDPPDCPPPKSPI